jgi:hypothetical protein
LQKVAGFAYVTRWAHLAEPKADGASILKENELGDSVVKSYLTTAADGKRYNVIY